MCLDYGHFKVEPSTLIQSGWKDFGSATFGSKLRFDNFQYKGSKDVPLNKWITAEGDKVSGADYRAGFHIYEDEKELNGSGKNSKRRVYYRNAHTRGRQSSLTVIVAQEMYVPSNPDDWPPL